MNRLSKKLNDQIPIEDRDAYEKTMENLLDFIEPIQLTLDKEMENIILNNTSDEDYEVSSWAYKQAHNNGRIQMIKEIKKILSLKKKLNNKADQA